MLTRCSTPEPSHRGATLADLYDPDVTPPDLRRAHQALDRAVDRLYRHVRFTSERERVEHLFALYERLHAPLAAEAAAKTTAKRRRRLRLPRRKLRRGTRITATRAGWKSG